MCTEELYQLPSDEGRTAFVTGAVASIFTVRVLISSAFPMLSRAWYSMACVPSEESVNGDEYLVQLPPLRR
jgi:hypothetical protein